MAPRSRSDKTFDVPLAKADPASALPGSDGFHFSETDEPHASRRKQMLAEHPEIRELIGYDWRTKYFVIALVAAQLYIASRVQNWSWGWILVFAYVVGGTITQTLTLAIHEISHNLLFASPLANRWFGIFANLPLVIAYSISFRKYHLEHHKWQGEVGIDMDVPTKLEGDLIGTSWWRKLIWIIFQVVFYALRPVLVSPYKPGRWEVANWAVCLAFDSWLVYNYGWMSVGYLLLSMLLGLGLHPMAGHFIAEHYVAVPGAETYSYYGPINFLGIWVGYHNEHHDFPRIPGSRLEQLRQIAPDYYTDLPQYTSWSKVIWDYIFSPHMGPFSRTIRATRGQKIKVM